MFLLKKEISLYKYVQNKNISKTNKREEKTQNR